MPKFQLLATPQALESISELRGRARESYEQKIRQLAAQGCKACGYRLTGFGSPWVCCVHLYGQYRLIAAFGDDHRIVILLVGEHRRGHRSDVYRRIFELLDFQVPPDSPRTKPPCCGRPADIQVDEPADIDSFFTSPLDLEARISRARR